MEVAHSNASRDGHVVLARKLQHPSGRGAEPFLIQPFNVFQRHGKPRGEHFGKHHEIGR